MCLLNYLLTYLLIYIAITLQNYSSIVFGLGLGTGLEFHSMVLRLGFYPRDAMLARVFATATCPSVRLSHAGIVPSRAKTGS